MMKLFYKIFGTHSTRLAVSVVIFSLMPASVVAGSKDDPLLSKVQVDQFEWRDEDVGGVWVLEAQAWVGKDLHKIWFKADAERTGGETEEAELQALYSRAVAPYWDFQVGLRRDFEPSPSRNWAVIGLQGLAPYFVEVDAALFLGEGGQSAFRLQAEHELLFTQKLILSQELALNFYGQNDSEAGVGSGLSDVELGLRLRYEVRREFAPYIGVTWNQSYGNSADFARSTGEDSGGLQWGLGVRLWF
mgnify:CR=1 FL=1